MDFRYKGNEKQYKFNVDVVNDVLEILTKIQEDPIIEDVEAGLNRLVNSVQYRNKLIRIADRSQGGWQTVQEYERDELADDSDDERKIRSADFRAQKGKSKKRLPSRRQNAAPYPPRVPAVAGMSLQSGYPPAAASSPSQLFRGPGTGGPPGMGAAGNQSPTIQCFGCGFYGHIRRNCPQQFPPGMVPLQGAQFGGHGEGTSFKR